ncbi:MAG TPA: SRPBCC family protein [Pyrinomonadaceae bacterium]|nr:SRPBCC family protein [Pyrinomonadaceae bacterium]
MKFSVSIEIDKPIDEVIRLFDDPDNLVKWMEGLQSFEHLEGIPGEVGAKSKLRFKSGKRDFEMIETITERDLPRSFTGTYEAKGVHNIVRNEFEPLGDGRTLYTSHNEFQFRGMMKLIALLMPGVFRKQSMKFLEAFKRFAESA